LNISLQKSFLFSFGVLLWECLTGELPYKGFDQMQVAFGIATNKYSLPIPSTCPEEFSQLMTSNEKILFVPKIIFICKDCWKILPHERPTFSDLLEQINQIMEPNEESYQSLQNDWRQEIQDMFNELKEKEQVKWFSVNFIESKYKILLGNS
jgi:serine/threonine protein kinase